jgi:broad specificity phosphatase PhoE
MELLIVRHAESEPNVAGTINSDPKLPSPLTARGRAQAGQLGNRLVSERIDLCITSELERSIATADIALAGRSIERRAMRELNDARAGDFEGAPAVEHQRWLAVNGLGSRNPGGGESQLDALRRYVRAFWSLAALSGERVLVVAHGMPIAWLRSAGEIAATGGTGDPDANFADPGVDFAGAPDRVRRGELIAATEILERFAIDSFGEE